MSGSSGDVLEIYELTGEERERRVGQSCVMFVECE